MLPLLCGVEERAGVRRRVGFGLPLSMNLVAADVRRLKLFHAEDVRAS